MRCDAYGAESQGGYQDKPFGGFLNNPVSVQPICENQASHRFRWTCACGHAGPIVQLCERHYAEFNGLSRFTNEQGRTEVMPWNIRRNVQACPRCASLAATPETQHKCAVRLVTVS